MPHSIESSTLRILNSNGKTVGTGFLVAANLVATCAHVVKDAGQSIDSMAGKSIKVQFNGKTEAVDALVLSEYWSDIDKEDVAILQVSEVPLNVFPLRMGKAGLCRLNDSLYTFGYAKTADEEGLGGFGEFRTWPQESKVFQFRMHEANFGHSGAPVYDESRRVVIGMINKGSNTNFRGSEITFATPTEIIWLICNQLKPAPAHYRRSPLTEGIDLLPYDYANRIQNFLTEYLGTDQKPVPFGGRENALRTLNTWLTESHPYLLIAAPAGRGKSALLVRWLDLLKDREDLDLAYVPVSIRFETNMERVVYASLAARLAFLQGDEIPTNPETSTAIYRGLISKYLGESPTNGRTLLVVIDGLDEAADWKAGANFMPAELPLGVRVVVSARYLAGDVDSDPWMRRLNWANSRLASTLPLLPLDRAGVAEVLIKMGRPLDELGHKVDIIAELYRLSEGDPLLVSLYVGDLSKKGNAVTHLSPDDLRHIQPGYKGYFDYWWIDQQQLWRDNKPWLEKHVRSVRNLLASAIGPLFVADMQELDPQLESDFIADALNVLQRFVIGENQSKGFTFSHPKLGQYFWEALTPIEQLRLEELFLSWGKRVLQEFVDGKRNVKNTMEVPAYVVRNYSAHLERAKRPIEEWLPLICHYQWAQAWFMVEGAYGGYLNDIHRVWEQCKLLDRQASEERRRIPYLSAQIRCALIEVSLHSLAGNIPYELVSFLVRDKIWSFSQAWVFIRQMPTNNMKIAAINGILPLMAENELAEVIYEIVEIIADVSTDKETILILKMLAQLAPLSELELVLQTGASMVSEDDLAELLSLITARIPVIGLRKVMLVSRELTNEKLRFEVLKDLILRIPIDELEFVWDDIYTIKNIQKIAELLSVVAQRLDNDGLFNLLGKTGSQSVLNFHLLISLSNNLSEDRLEHLLTALTASTQEPKKLAEILTVLSRRIPKKAVKKLLALAETLDKMDRIRVLVNLAFQAPEIRNETKTAVMGINNKNERISLLISLAPVFPELDNELVLLIAKTKDEQRRSDLLISLPSVVVERKFDQLLKLTKAIENEAARSQVLEYLAHYVPIQKVARLFDETNKMVVYHKTDVLSVLSVLVERIPAEDLNILLQTLRPFLTSTEGVGGNLIDLEFRARYEKFNLLSTFAERMLQDELGNVLEIISELIDVMDISFASNITNILVVISRRIREENLEKVLNILGKLSHELDLSDVLSILARRMKPDELWNLLSITRNTRERVELLRIMAWRLPVEEYESILRNARTKHERIYVLSVMSRRVPNLKIELLELLSYDEDVPLVVSILVDLARQDPTMVRMVLEKAWSTQNMDLFFSSLERLTKYVPSASTNALEIVRIIGDDDSFSRVLESMIRFLPQEELESVLELAKKMKNKQNSAHVLSVLTRRMPEISEEAINSVRWIQDKKVRVHILSLLIDSLHKDHLKNIAEAIGLVKNEKVQLELLSAIAMRIPENELINIFIKAMKLGDARTRARVLSGFIQKLPDKDLAQAREAIKSISSKKERSFLITALDGREINKKETFNEFDMMNETNNWFHAVNTNQACGDIKKDYLRIEDLISENARYWRSHFYIELIPFLRTIISIGSMDTSREVFYALRDVSTWWT